MISRFLLFVVVALSLALAPTQLATPPQSAWQQARQQPSSAHEVASSYNSPQPDIVPAAPAAGPHESALIPVSPGSPPKNRPKLALIIDDMGYNQALGQQLLALHLTLNFSFLPQAPHTQELVQLAQQEGRTILVHMPMEPQSQQWKLEPLSLHTRDSREELQQKVEKMVGAIPQASGTNNHMGSRFTQDREKMKIVLEQLRQHQLFFVDSYTSGASVGEKIARSMGIPTARRDVFLDNEHNVAAICGQLRQVVARAQNEQSAIAIGHPNQAMLKALVSCAPQILEGVELVSVAELVR